MRACSRHLDRARQRQRRPRGRRRHRPRRRAAGARRVLAAPHLAHRRGGAGLLLRLRQRRHVAAVPRGARAAGVPRVRLGGLPRGQPALRRRGGGRGAQRGPGGAGAGLPLRAAAGDGAREAAAGHHPHLLAHPLAEPRVLRHLPVAARDPAGHARQHDPRLPHALPLQELHRDGGPLPGGAHRARALDDLVPARRRRWSRAIRSRSSGPATPRLRPGHRSTHAGAVSSSGSGCPPTSAWPSASTASTTPRASSSACTRSSALLEKSPRMDRPIRLRAGGRADAQRAGGVPQLPGAHRSA